MSQSNTETTTTTTTSTLNLKDTPVSIVLPTRPVIHKIKKSNKDSFRTSRFVAPSTKKNNRNSPPVISDSIECNGTSGSSGNNVNSVSVTGAYKPRPIRWCSNSAIDNEHSRKKKTSCCLPQIKNGKVVGLCCSSHHHS